jgi:heptosyltransferase III
MPSFPCESVLIVRPGALGDAVLTLPLLQALRSAGARRFAILGVPGHWRWLRAAENNVTIVDWSSPDWLGLASPEVPLAASALRLLSSVTGAVVCLRSGLDEAVMTLRRTGVREVLPGVPSVWPEPSNEADDDRHASDRLLEPLRRYLGDAFCGPFLSVGTGSRLTQAGEPFLSVTDGERASALRRLGMATPPAAGFFAVHPGSGGRSKCWPADRYVELLRRATQTLPLEPLLFLGPAEEESLQPVLRGLPEKTRLVRSFPLREVMALLTMARVFVGNDAGVTHLAARCCPTIQLFGATRPSRWTALGSNVTALQAPGGMLERLELETVWETVRSH